MNALRNFVELIIVSLAEWNRINAGRIAGSFAFFTLFSLAPLLFITATFLAMLVPVGARDEVLTWVSQGLSAQAARFLGIMFSTIDLSTSSGVIASLISIGFLIYSSTTLFSQLKLALDEIWEVKPEHSPLIVFFFRHFVGLLALIIACIVLATITIVGILLRRVGIGSNLDTADDTIAAILQFAFFFTASFLISAVIYKRLPSVRLEWRDVWLAAVVTGLVFTVSKYPMEIYLSHYTDAEVYGTAGAIFIILFWIYALGLMFVYGGVFCRAFAERYGSKKALSQPQADE